jgi:tetratricopeptide (TPR) repeat protein
MGGTQKGAVQKREASEGSYLEKILTGWKPCLLIVLIGFLVYSKALFLEFVRLDDDKLIIDNYSFISSLANLPRLFVDDVFHDTSGDSFYRPILALSLMLDSQFGKSRPFVYHLTNILIHLFASCLVFAFLNKMRYRKDLAFLFSLMFTVHPLLTQAVAWIPGRNDSLLTLFVLSAFIFFLDFLETGKPKSAGLHILFFALAAFTKETAMMVIPVCLLYLMILRKGRLFSSMKRVGLGWITVLILWGILRHIALSGQGEKTVWKIVQSASINFPVIIQVLGKIFLPFNLSILPTVENTTLVYGIITASGLISALLLSRQVRYPYVLFGFCWFMLFLLPTFAPTFAVPGTMLTVFLEHRNYLPMVGVIMMLFEMDWIKRADLRRASLFIPFLGVLLLFSGITFFRLNDFKDKFSYWQSAVTADPRSVIAHMNLGSAYHTDGQLDRAEMEFRKTLELNPNQAMGYSNLADIAIQRNRLQEAMHYVQKALAADPLYAEGHYNLGKIHYLQNNLRESELALTETIRLKKDHFAAHFGLGILYLKKERLDDAEKMLRKALELNPFYPDTLFNLGVIRSKQGRLPEAEELWVKALRLKPDHVDAELHLAIYYYNKRDFSKAARHFSALRRKGLRIDPKIAEQLNIQ